MADGVVEVAGDPSALLGYREKTLALSVALDTQGTLPEIGEMLASQAGSLAGE